MMMIGNDTGNGITIAGANIWFLRKRVHWYVIFGQNQHISEDGWFYSGNEITVLVQQTVIEMLQQANRLFYGGWGRMGEVEAEPNEWHERSCMVRYHYLLDVGFMRHDKPMKMDFVTILVTMVMVRKQCCQMVGWRPVCTSQFGDMNL